MSAKKVLAAAILLPTIPILLVIRVLDWAWEVYHS